MNADELEYLVERCLGEGVPPGVVARVFDLSPDLVREAHALMKVRRYGTEDLAEYTLQAQWDAIEQARHVLAHGSPAERAKFSAALLRAPMARTAKDLPDSVRKGRAELDEVLAAMRTGEPGPKPKRSRFVATVGHEQDAG